MSETKTQAHQAHDVIKQLSIQRITATSRKIVIDKVIVEKPFILQINNTIALEILCTPCDIKELVIGLLFSENIIDRAEDIVAFACDGDLIKVQVKKATEELLAQQKLVLAPNHIKTTEAHNYNWQQTYSYIRPNKQQIKTIHAKKIINKINELQKRQKIFAKTGAAHAAMLFNQDGKELYFAEDIGRHNAIDKVIGKCLQRHGFIPPACGIALSSRVSFELVCKIARANIELIAAVSAPSSLAIEAAEYWKITLCGFVRDGKMNVYAHP